MAGLVAWFSFCALIIVIAGTYMAQGADRIAEVTGIGRTLVGLVLLAAGTSLPELMVGWTAVRMGSPDLTLGDLLGSSLMNLLILAILDLFTRSHTRMLSSRAAVHALSAGGTIVLKTIVLIAILFGGQFTFLRMGAGAWAIGIAYLLCFRLIVLDQQVGRNEAAIAAEAEATPPGMTFGQAVLVYLACAGAIIYASATARSHGGSSRRADRTRQDVFRSGVYRRRYVVTGSHRHVRRSAAGGARSGDRQHPGEQRV